MKGRGWLFVVIAAVLLVGAGILVATSQPDAQVVGDMPTSRPALEAVSDSTPPSVRQEVAEVLVEPPKSLEERWQELEHCQIDLARAVYLDNWQLFSHSDRWEEVLHENIDIAFLDNDERLPGVIHITNIRQLATAERVFLFNTVGLVGEIDDGKPVLKDELLCRPSPISTVAASSSYDSKYDLTVHHIEQDDQLLDVAVSVSEGRRYTEDELVWLYQNWRRTNVCGFYLGSGLTINEAATLVWSPYANAPAKYLIPLVGLGVGTDLQLEEHLVSADYSYERVSQKRFVLFKARPNDLLMVLVEPDREPGR
ncbi:MAG: hypothetical protein ABH814_02840 [bacterium]